MYIQVRARHIAMLYSTINVYNPYIHVHGISPIFVYTFLSNLIVCTSIKLFILHAAEVYLVECGMI